MKYSRNQILRLRTYLNESKNVHNSKIQVIFSFWEEGFEIFLNRFRSLLSKLNTIFCSPVFIKYGAFIHSAVLHWTTLYCSALHCNTRLSVTYRINAKGYFFSLTHTACLVDRQIVSLGDSAMWNDQDQTKASFFLTQQNALIYYFQFTSVLVELKLQSIGLNCW